MTGARPAAPHAGAPAVSVLMSVYNGAASVGDTLESLRAQTMREWELVVVDDGSTDGTAALLERAAAADPRIIVLRNEVRLGLPASLNRAMGSARAELLARLDADDVAHPERFARQCEFLARNPAIDVLGTGAELIDEQGVMLAPLRPIEHHDDLARVRYRRTPVLHPSVMMRRDVLRQLGGYDARLRRAQDHDLWLRAMHAGARFQNLLEPLIRYRVRRRPSLQGTMYVAFVIARAALREGSFLRHGWYAAFHLLLGLLVRSGLYSPRWLGEPAPRGR